MQVMLNFIIFFVGVVNNMYLSALGPFVSLGIDMTDMMNRTNPGSWAHVAYEKLKEYWKRRRIKCRFFVSRSTLTGVWWDKLCGPCGPQPLPERHAEVVSQSTHMGMSYGNPFVNETSVSR